MMFWAMYKKELQEEKSSLALMAGALLGAMFALFWQVDEPVFRFGGVAAMTILLPFFGLLRTYQTIRSDWQDNTIQWTLSFPISGWIPLASKLLAVLTSLTVLFLVLVVGALSQLAQSPAGVYMSEFLSLLRMFMLLGGLSYVCFLPILFLGYLVARGLPRWHGAVTIVVFLAGMYVFGRMLTNAGTYLPATWMPMYNVSMGIDYVDISLQMVNVSPLYGAVFFGVLTFWASVRLWNRRIDA